MPFIIKPTGVGTIFETGPLDGPFLTHYEPVEPPFENVIYSKVRFNPVAKNFK